MLRCYINSTQQKLTLSMPKGTVNETRIKYSQIVPFSFQRFGDGLITLLDLASTQFDESYVVLCL